LLGAAAFVIRTMQPPVAFPPRDVAQDAATPAS
jgi:hypothetical protein